MTNAENLQYEYQWLKMAASDDTIDSPFWPTFGELTLLLSKELLLMKKAKVQYAEIQVRQIPTDDKRWVRLEPYHPTGEVMDIIAQSNSRATEGISCALIIELTTTLKALSNAFPNLNRHEVHSLGPQIGGIHWVELVIASSNYVRHRDEWKEAASNGHAPNKRQKTSVLPLERSGLSGVWQGNTTYLEIAQHLEITNWENLFSKVSKWLGCCLPHHKAHC